MERMVISLGFSGKNMVISWEILATQGKRGFIEANSQ